MCKEINKLIKMLFVHATSLQVAGSFLGGASVLTYKSTWASDSLKVRACACNYRVHPVFQVEGQS